MLSNLLENPETVQNIEVLTMNRHGRAKQQEALGSVRDAQIHKSKLALGRPSQIT